MIKRSHIRQFLAVVDAGSFTQAAARLRVTQPALSVGIAELEKLTGAQLIVRDRRRIRLTEAGGRFLPIARGLESSFREADSFGDGSRVEWPELKLGLIKTLPEQAVQRMIASLCQHFTIELVEGTDGELRAGLSDGRLNLTLGLLRHDEVGKDVIELADEPYVMLTSSQHPLAGQVDVAPEDLASEVMIIRRSCEMLDQTSRFFTRHKVRPRFALRSESEERCIGMVAAGLGITNVPASLIRKGTAPLLVKGYNLRRRVGIRLAEGWNDTAREKLEIAANAYRNSL